MAKDIQAIVLAVGITKGAPFTADFIPKVSIVDPPTVVDSITREITATNSWIVGGTDPAPAATERLRFTGGIVSDTGIGFDNFIAGRGAAAQGLAGANNVVIGVLASASGNVNLTNNVVIGAGAAVGGTNTLGQNVVIGAGVVYSYSAGTQAGNNVLIGNQFTLSAFFDGVVIGGGAVTPVGVAGGVYIGRQVRFAAVSNAVAVGNTSRVDANNGSAFGDGARAAFTTSIALGRNAITTAVNQMVVGAINLGIQDVLIGEGELATGGALGLTIRTSGSQGTDTAGGILTVRGSIGTGASVGGGFRVAVGRKVASGFIGQTVTDALEVQGGSLNVGVIGAGTVNDYAGAEGAFYIGTAFQNPTGTPVSGFVLYRDTATGQLKCIGPAGTTTVLAAP